MIKEGGFMARDALEKKDPVDILARTIWGEARGEGYKGMQAIASVILNRSKYALSKKRGFWWGGDIVSVCLKPWQFSCWNKNDPNRKKLLTVTTYDRSFELALSIAQRAIDGELEDITGGSDHYHTVTIKPFWAEGEEPVCQIGNHKFYSLYCT